MSQAAKLIAKWLPRLGLADWDVRLKFDPLRRQDEDQITAILADIECDPIYLDATLRVFPGFNDEKPDDQEEAIVHELVHCLVSEQNRLIESSRDGRLITPLEARDANERLTQKLTNAILEAWRRGK